MATHFAVSLSFVIKLLHRQHTTGMVAVPRSRATAGRGRRPVPAGATECDASGSRRGVAGGWWLNVEPHGHLAGPTERLGWGRK